MKLAAVPYTEPFAGAFGKNKRPEQSTIRHPCTKNTTKRNTSQSAQTQIPPNPYVLPQLVIPTTTHSCMTNPPTHQPINASRDPWTHLQHYTPTRTQCHTVCRTKCHTSATQITLSPHHSNHSTIYPSRLFSFALIKMDRP